MGEGIARWSNLMATCHGVRMARVASNTRGLSREPLIGPLRDFANRTTRGSMNETDIPAASVIVVSRYPAAA